MKKLEVKDGVYMETLVQMLWGVGKYKIQPRVLFLIELIRESEGGFFVTEEKRGLIMDRLRITRGNYDLMLDRLSVSGDVRRDNGILYLNPKWRAVKECDGNFLISKKNSLDVKE